jgi:hypothetical protein
MKKLILKPVLAVGALIGAIALLCTLMPKLPDTYARDHLAGQQADQDKFPDRNLTDYVSNWAALDRARKEEAQAASKSAYDVGYRAGLEIYAALGSVRVVDVDRFFNKQAEIMIPYTKKHASDSAADEAWSEDFVQGSFQALKDKNLYLKIDAAVVSLRDPVGMRRAMINHFQ